MNNKVMLIGKLVKIVPNEKYAVIEIKRNSNQTDSIRVKYTNNIMDIAVLLNTSVKVEGTLYTFNTKHNIENNGKCKTKLNIFVKGSIQINNTPFDKYNEVKYTGYLVKQPITRLTPLGRTITDLMIVINDENRKSYYIPVITFGDLANACSNYKIGDKLNLTGRIQSREYLKVINNEEIVKTAYEVAARVVFKEE